MLQIPTNWTQHFSFSSVAFKDKKKRKEAFSAGPEGALFVLSGNNGGVIYITRGGRTCNVSFYTPKTNPDVVLRVTSIQL